MPFPGVSAVLENGEKLGLWRFVRLGGSRVVIPPADIYLFGAWHPGYQHLLGLGGRLGVLHTSSIGEMDFTPVEWGYLDGVLLDPRIEFVWFGDPALARLFPQKGFYAPYPLACLEPLDMEKQDIITLFCPGGPKKNLANQLAAVALVQREMALTLHTNLGEYERVMRALGVKYVLHPWLPRADYHRLLASARVNLAISWSETFNYQVAEAAFLGVPSAVSPAVEWMPEHCKVLNPNSPEEIAKKALALVRGPTDIREWVERVAQSQNAVLTHALERFTR